MDTLKILYSLDTKKTYNWGDFSVPLMVTDEKGSLYVIVSSFIPIDETDNTQEVSAETSNLFFIVDLSDGSVDSNGYYSIKELIDIYCAEGINLMPVKVDMLVKDYLETKKLINVNS